MNDSVNEKEKLMHIAFDRLAEEYPEGLYDFLYAHDRRTYDEINRLEDKVNENFLNGGSVNDLKAILREYWTVHMEAIKAFKGNGKPDVPLSEVRKARIREMETAHA